MNFSNLYVNGASHTKFRNHKLWPEHLAEHYNINLKNQAHQGKTVESILTQTINDLDKHTPRETLVVLHLPTTTVRQCWYRIDDKQISEVPVTIWQMPEPQKIWKIYYTQITNDFDMYAKWLLQILNIQNFLKVNNFFYHIIFDNTEFYHDGKTRTYLEEVDLDIQKVEYRDDPVFNKFKNIRHKHIDNANITSGITKWFEKNCEKDWCLDGVHWNSQAHQKFVKELLVKNINRCLCLD